MILKSVWPLSIVTSVSLHVDKILSEGFCGFPSLLNIIYLESKSGKIVVLEVEVQKQRGDILTSLFFDKVCPQVKNNSCPTPTYTFQKSARVCVCVVFLHVSDVVCILNEGRKHISYISGSSNLIPLKVVPHHHGDQISIYRSSYLVKAEF